MQPSLAMSSSTTPLYLEPVPDRHLLPEQRKKVVSAWHDAIQQAGLEEILKGNLPPSEQYGTEPTPLDTAPTIEPLSPNTAASRNVPQPSQKEINDAAAKRTLLVAENTRRATLRATKLAEYKAQLGVAILRALETNASALATEYRKKHVLRAESADLPATYDGVAMLAAFKQEKNHNDTERQGQSAEDLMAELEINLPDNCTSSQFSQHWDKFAKEVEPYLERPMTAKLQVRWMLARLPTGLIEQKDAITGELRRANKLDDVDEALVLCRERCDDRHDPKLGVPDVVPALTARKAALSLAHAALHGGPSGQSSKPPEVLVGKGKGKAAQAGPPMGGRSRLLLLVKPREALPTAMPAARCRLPAIGSAAVAGASAPPVPCAASPAVAWRRWRWGRRRHARQIANFAFTSPYRKIRSF